MNVQTSFPNLRWCLILLQAVWVPSGRISHPLSLRAGPRNSDVRCRSARTFGQWVCGCRRRQSAGWERSIIRIRQVRCAVRSLDEEESVGTPRIRTTRVRTAVPENSRRRRGVRRGGESRVRFRFKLRGDLLWCGQKLRSETCNSHSAAVHRNSAPYDKAPKRRNVCVHGSCAKVDLIV
jgi:hypothetical protein